MPTVVDSSGWIEFITDGPNCASFQKAILDTEQLIVPSIAITEVYRWVARVTSQANALIVAASMKQGTIVALDEQLAISAADYGNKHNLPLADSIIYATARASSAKLLTQDADFDGLPHVSYIPHPKKKA